MLGEVSTKDGRLLRITLLVLRNFLQKILKAIYLDAAELWRISGKVQGSGLRCEHRAHVRITSTRSCAPPERSSTVVWPGFRTRTCTTFPPEVAYGRPSSPVASPRRSPTRSSMGRTWSAAAAGEVSRESSSSFRSRFFSGRGLSFATFPEFARRCAPAESPATSLY